ncbi:MAG: tRNA pseudouridine(13) synthase TruD [Nitrososphaerota archaeon]|nr:tRNA pseudouridine(13) synthase TruD [Candidatus Bathyarchaeota archaeon]MDW8048978.1 tRNA pseudouridine(13) synthase TruD [Nitrososphaerota archaeon]
MPDIEVKLGIEAYASKTPGIGGLIRVSNEDFIVEEILTDGSIASVDTNPPQTPFALDRYVICLLIKNGWETISAVRRIAEALNIPVDQIGFAGLKDAQALTGQYISIGGVSPKKISDLRLNDDVRVYPVKSSSEKISPKNLFGNRFRINVRSIKCHITTTSKRIEKIKRELDDFGGIPNFFGHQRFGTVRPITHLVGYLLLRNEWERAALLYLSSTSPYESHNVSEARRYLQDTRDFRGALKLFPRRLVYERLMLTHLAKYPGDFLGAFRRLPREIRVIFIHAYQSFLFNRFLSERMKRSIPLREVQEGDYVVILDDKGLPTGNYEKTMASNITRIRDGVEKGRMAVCLPLPGFRRCFSGGIQGEIENDVLEEEGVTHESFRVEKMLEISAAGGFRRALSPILNFHAPGEVDRETREVKVHFSFTLQKGSYATVVLREFMKPKFPVEAGF